ncbi:MAG: hypothetical protein QNI98_02875 [Woeseiaceae bacterium]|nr:hypothetical protein [Woeseiaceae bacterium]
MAPAPWNAAAAPLGVLLAGRNPIVAFYPRIRRIIVRFIQLMQKYNKRCLGRSLRAKGADQPKNALPGWQPQYLKNP